MNTSPLTAVCLVIGMLSSPIVPRALAGDTNQDDKVLAVLQDTLSFAADVRLQMNAGESNEVTRTRAKALVARFTGIGAKGDWGDAYDKVMGFRDKQLDFLAALMCVYSCAGDHDGAFRVYHERGRWRMCKPSTVDAARWLLLHVKDPQLLVQGYIWIAPKGGDIDAPMPYKSNLLSRVVFAYAALGDTNRADGVAHRLKQMGSSEEHQQEP
jgi:hypothetical protein